MINIAIKKLDIKKDSRGWLSEILRPEDLVKKKFGQIFITVAYPDQTKGVHYHKRKTEWYCVIKGRGLVTVINNKTRKKQEIEIGEQNMVLVKIPPNNIHWIKNTGSENMYVLIYIDEEFNPLDSDTFQS